MIDKITANQVTCTLCGLKFNKDECLCSDCALNADCRVLCCPHCGYRMVDDSREKVQFERLKRMFAWLKKKIIKMKPWN